MTDRIIVGAISTNCWIVSPSALSAPGALSPCILIDPGEDADDIIARLEAKKRYPEYIVLTHGHLDHIAALPDIREQYREYHPRIAIHSLDADHLGPGALDRHRRDFSALGSFSYVDSLWKPMPAADILLAEGDRLGPFRVMHLPGHSPGSIALYNDQEKLLFSGDTLFNNGAGRTDLPGGDRKQLQESLERLFSMDGEIRVCPGHGPETSLGAEKRRYQ